MAEANGNRLWLKILGPLVPLAITGLIGYGVLKSDVKHVSDDVQTRAPREVVEAEYQALLRELQSINQRLDRIERRP